MRIKENEFDNLLAEGKTSPTADTIGIKRNLQEIDEIFKSDDLDDIRYAERQVKKYKSELDRIINEFNEFNSYWERKYQAFKEFIEDCKRFDFIREDIDENLDDNFDLDEAYYGGAFDIEEDQYFTRDDLNEFGYELEDKFREAINAKYGEVNLVSIYLEDSELEVTIGVGSEYEATKTIKVDMRKIRTPKDLYKYMDKLLNMFLDDFRRASVLYRAVYTDSKDKEHEIYVFETEFDKEWPYIINIDGVVTGRANHDNLFKELDRELKGKFGEGSLKRKNLDEEALSLAALAIPMLTSAAQGFGQSVGNKLMDKI